MYKDFSKISRNSGMTLIELMVVIVIFGIITSITVFDYGNFNSSASIQNLSDDIALSIRKAQSYATGTQGSANFGFDNGYGIHFTISPGIAGNAIAGSNKSFILYTDFNPPGGGYIFSGAPICTKATPSNECSEIFNITGAETIQDIYIDKGAGLENINSLGPDASLDIIFLRPNPDAMFCLKIGLNSGPACDVPNISHADIVISNNQSGDRLKTKTISIQNTGQIYIQ